MSSNPFDTTDFWNVWKTSIGTQYLAHLDDRLRRDHDKLLRKLSTEFGRQSLEVFSRRGFDEPCEKYARAYHTNARVVLDNSSMRWEPETLEEPPLMAKLRQIIHVNSLVMTVPTSREE